LDADTVQAEGSVEIRIGKPDGELLAQAMLGAEPQITFPLGNRPVMGDVYVIYRNDKVKSAEDAVLYLKWIRFNR